MSKLLFVFLMMVSMNVSASLEAECLAKIIHREAVGESLAGQIVLGQAVKNRVKNTRSTFCKVEGVARVSKSSKKMLSVAYKVLSLKVDLSEGADSWNTGSSPAYKGVVKTVVGRHVFYKMGK